MVATALKTLRLARSTTDLVELLTSLNDEVKPDLLPGQFITLFAGMLDPANATIDVALAGHPMLVANPEGDLFCARSASLVWPWPDRWLVIPSRTVQRLQLQPEIALQYTDGIIEAIDENDEDYGMYRLCASLFGYLDDASSQDVVDGMAAEVSEFAHGEVDDDVTIMAMALLPEDDDDLEVEA